MPDLRAVPSAEAPLIEDAQRLTRDASSEDIEAQLAALAIADLGPLREGVVLAAIRGATGRSPVDLRATLHELRRQLKRVDAPPASWRDGLKLNRFGDPQPTAANVAHALRAAPEWQGVFMRSDFDDRAWVRAKPPWANGAWTAERPMRDADEAAVLVWVQQQGINAKLPDVRAALRVVLDDHPWHPVRDWLRSLTWDGEIRLDAWLHRALGGAPIAGYTDEVGTRWLTSAVARVMQPGCQAKYVLALEGPQDLGKSKALEILARPWFCDDLVSISKTDAKLQLMGAIIVEIADLESIRGASVSAIKAFISCRSDRYRRPYGTQMQDVPRQCVFAATTDDCEWLQDDTGNVRFWPVRCGVGAMDLGWLEAHRDQLWAEALVRYEAGEQWWFEAGAAPVLREEQEQRAAYDDFEARIRDWLSAHEPERITVTELLTRCLQIEDARDHTKAMQSRVGRIMINRIGWQMMRSAGKRWYEPS